MKSIPFYPNSPDDKHCVGAVFKMIYKYFLDKDYSWEEIDKITGAVEGKGTWTFPALTDLVHQGIKVTHIELIDYKKLSENINYLYDVVGKNTADYYINESNLPDVLNKIPEYLKSVTQIVRKSSTDEVIEFLKKGSLVGIEVNSAILNKKPGFNLHYVLVYDFDGENIFLHDPGLPPIPSRKLNLREFKDCFEYPGSAQALTAFSRR